MRSKHFFVRAINILIIAGVLLYYNQVLSLHQQLDKANAAMAAMAAESTQSAAEGAVQEEEGPYKDGTYQGSAKGFGGTITVEITIEQGYLSGLEIISAENEDAAYYNMAVQVLDSIADQQSIEGVDTVSGATYTSRGIINAAAEAFGKAGKN